MPFASHKTEYKHAIPAKWVSVAKSVLRLIVYRNAIIFTTSPRAFRLVVEESRWEGQGAEGTVVNDDLRLAMNRCRCSGVGEVSIADAAVIGISEADWRRCTSAQTHACDRSRRGGPRDERAQCWRYTALTTAV